MIAIIGILSAVSVVSYTGYKSSAEMKKAEVSLNTIYLAEQEYKSNNGIYYYNGSISNIVSNLFDGVDDLSKQKYIFLITGSGDTLSIVAKNNTSGCQLTLNEKNKLTKSNC